MRFIQYVRYEMNFRTFDFKLHTLRTWRSLKWSKLADPRWKTTGGFWPEGKFYAGKVFSKMDHEHIFFMKLNKLKWPLYSWLEGKHKKKVGPGVKATDTSDTKIKRRRDKKRFVMWNKVNLRTEIVGGDTLLFREFTAESSVNSLTGMR